MGNQSVVHSLDCSCITYKSKSVKQTVIRERKKHLKTFFERGKSCALVVHHLWAEQTVIVINAFN